MDDMLALVQAVDQGEAPSFVTVRRLDTRAVKRDLYSLLFAYAFCLGLVALIPIAVPRKGNGFGQIEAMVFLGLVFTALIAPFTVAPIQRLQNASSSLLAMGGGVLALRDRGKLKTWDLHTLRPEVTAYTHGSKVSRVAVWHQNDKPETIINHDGFGDMAEIARDLRDALRATRP